MSSIIRLYFSIEFCCSFLHHHNLRKHLTDVFLNFLNVFKMENITLGANISEIIILDSKMDNSTIALNSLRIFFGLTAICGNLLIITCVFKYRILRNPTNLVIANLSAADLLNGCNMVVVSVMNLIFFAELLTTHYTFERIKHGFVNSGFLMNNMAIFYIALERFICIKLALQYNSIITFSLVLFTFVLTWICGAIFTFSIAVLDLAERPVILSCIHGIIGLGTLILYIYVATVAYKKSKQIAPQPQVLDGSTAETLDNQKAQWKITKFLALVLGVYYGSYLPMVIMRASDPNNVNRCDSSKIMGLFAMTIWGLNINVNPFLYVWKSRNFRICVKKIFAINPNEVDFQ